MSTLNKLSEETSIHPKAVEILAFFDELEKEIVKIDLSLNMQCVYRSGNKKSVCTSAETDWKEEVKERYRYLKIILGSSEFYMTVDLDKGTTYGYITSRNILPGRIPNKTVHPGKLGPNTLLKMLYRFNFDPTSVIEGYYQDWLLGKPVDVVDPSNSPLFN